MMEQKEINGAGEEGGKNFSSGSVSEKLDQERESSCV